MIKLFTASGERLWPTLICAVWLGFACVACKDAAAGSADSAVSPAKDAAVGGEDLLAEGCRPDQPATAYTARASGAESVDSPEGRAPLPCLTLTGYGSAESTLGIAKDGSLFFAPAFAPEGNGVLRSRDHGRNWQLLVPSWADGAGHKKAQPYLFLDPSTDRVFFASSTAGLSIGGGGFDLSISRDGGDSWDHQLVASDTGDWLKRPHLQCRARLRTTQTSCISLHHRRSRRPPHSWV
jgi:hypothetical protein